MSNPSINRSEQALDDYFAQLLGDEIEIDQPVVAVPDAASIAPDVPDKPDLFNSEPETEIVPKFEKIEAEETYPVPLVREIEVPKLDDIQKLLDQISSKNVADEPEIESIIEQNTLQMGLQRQVSEQVESSKPAPQVEELFEEDTQVITEELAPPLVEYTEEVEVEVEVEVEAEASLQPQESKQLTWTSSQRAESFQVLYFEVNGVTFAVPLDELGGIHKIGELSHLIGRPSWYLGLQTSRDSQLDVVDTAKWVMPEKLQDDLYKDEYQYIVMLGQSNWGLASNQLKGTELLELEAIRWRKNAGKRPWLAGMVKEKMCALVHVDALIEMLKSGLDAQALNG
jgi:purine-binding chemotaxis protein CheW